MVYTSQLRIVKLISQIIVSATSVKEIMPSQSPSGSTTKKMQIYTNKTVMRLLILYTSSNWLVLSLKLPTFNIQRS